MATGLEVLGAVGAAFQLVELAAKAFKLFSDMSTGFKDANGEAALIRRELFNFKQSAKFAHNNLKHLRVDDIGLQQSLLKYESSISQLGHEMQAIHGRKRPWGQTKNWMKLMSKDSEVTMLRHQLKQHTSELAEKFTLVTLKEIRDAVKEIEAVGQAHYDLSKNARQEDTLWKQADTLWKQASTESLNIIKAAVDGGASLQTPVLSPYRFDDDHLFDLDTPPLSPSPPGSAPISPVESVSPDWIEQLNCPFPLTRRHSTDTLAWCEGSDCYANSIHSSKTGDGRHRFTRSTETVFSVSVASSD